MLHKWLLPNYPKKICKVALVLLLIFGYYDTCTAFANIHTIEVDGFYVMGDDGLKENESIAKERARMEAKRTATEKAGIFVESFSSVKNGQLIKDEINTVSSQLLEIKSEKITTEIIDGNVCYKCHIVAVLNSSNITEKLNQDRQKLYEEIEQYRRKEQELEAIKNELLELKSRYKTANADEKKEISQKVKRNEEHFKAIEYVDKGNAYYYQEKYNQAIEFYRHALELDFNLSSAWNNLGFSYCRIHDFQKGIEYLFMATKFDPDNPGIWSNIGYAYGQIGEYQKSIKYCRKATLELNSEFSFAWNNLGASYGGIGDYQAEIIYCTKATQLDPKNMYAWNNLGVAYNGIEDYKKAIECLQKAIELDNKCASSWYNLGFAYGKTNYWDKSAYCLSNALKLDSNNPKYNEMYRYVKQRLSNN